MAAFYPGFFGLSNASEAYSAKAARLLQGASTVTLTGSLSTKARGKRA